MEFLYVRLPPRDTGWMGAEASKLDSMSILGRHAPVVYGLALLLVVRIRLEESSDNSNSRRESLLCTSKWLLLLLRRFPHRSGISDAADIGRLSLIAAACGLLVSHVSERRGALLSRCRASGKTFMPLRRDKLVSMLRFCGSKTAAFKVIVFFISCYLNDAHFFLSSIQISLARATSANACIWPW